MIMPPVMVLTIQSLPDAGLVKLRLESTGICKPNLGCAAAACCSNNVAVAVSLYICLLCGSYQESRCNLAGIVAADFYSDRVN
jgi:hypothetical protein